MEPFIVSARKYRPETFEDVVGQSAITKTLENAIESNHLAQALLFTGPRGVGKTTCARILAKKINHESGDFDPDEDFAFNIFELDAASNNGVDQIRAIVDQVRIPPQVGKYKVYIIDEVHMLSNAAFNAFLKTLEEPPAHAIFILATTEKHKIIPTILSRCQIFDFKRITVSAMREHLKRIAEREGINAEEDALQIIAQKADGALRDSLSIFDRVVSFSGKELTVQAVTENLNVLDRDTYFKFTDLILENNIPQCLVDYDVIMSKGFDGHHFISGLATHFRDLMVCQDPKTIGLLEVADVTKKKYLEQSQKTDLSFLRRALEISNKADFDYRSSRNPRLLIELTLMQLASITTDGEKKNEVTQIIPATAFDQAPVQQTEAKKELPQPSTPQEEAAPSNSEQPPSIEAQENVDVSSSIEQHADHKSAVADASESYSQPSDSSTQEIEEKRRQLNERLKNKISNSSLKGISYKKEVKAKKQKHKIPQDNLPEEPFSQEQFSLVWDKYIQHLQNQGQMILAGILRVDSPKVNGNEIYLKFPNSSMKKDLERDQGKVLDYIKRELRNYAIHFKIDVDKTVTKKYVYTDQDKYEKLVEKNPNVDLLRRTFELDF
ncbi:DNA polymerase III subunit gamma/tau [Nonlabens spongiae]|uniref:DNA polymerase III subunit gamma/tau n=1 Tax=Nonlabens spongiae TaxID=331648 RepID=A0A1W6MHX0_9FLAO|nr:DNA polymerase III subunit gamma/tau [Nonlabens spongiae]ARN77069.1 DNA polymerase III subunit gamma/tau [Nonlabens spongiae]